MTLKNPQEFMYHKTPTNQPTSQPNLYFYLHIYFLIQDLYIHIYIYIYIYIYLFLLLEINDCSVSFCQVYPQPNRPGIKTPVRPCQED